jgi:HK97 family phage major capsid protein
MEIREMQIEDIETRSAEIDAEMEKEGADLDALKSEAEQLNARKAELREAAQAKKAEAEQAASSTEVVKTFEERKMEKTFTPDSVEYRDAYLKSLMGLPMEVEERAALTSAASVIPTETLNKIYGKLEENPLIGELDALHIPGYVSVPKATTVNDASWLAVASASTDSADAVGYVALTAKKLIKTIEITADIQAMSIPAFQTWLVNKLAQKMEAAICAAVVNGAGSATVPQGIGQGGISASTAISSASIETFSAFMGGVGTAYQRTAVWVMSPKTFFGKVVPLANDVNGGVVMNGLDYRFLGHKVVLDANVDGCKFKNGSTAETANADHIIFGSLKEGYVFNYGEGIAIEADQSVAFRSGSTVYRAMALCDGAVVDSEAFAWTTIA